MDTIGHVEERINYMNRFPLDDPQYMENFHYISGMLDVYGFERSYIDRDVVGTWRAFSYSVSHRMGLKAYFALMAIIEHDEQALQNYATDFYKVDFDMIRRNPDMPFLWVLRELGTHLYFLKSREADKTDAQAVKEAFEHALDAVTTFGGICYIGYWDGNELHKVSVDNRKEELLALKQSLEEE